MRILLTNDDGVFAPSLHSLYSRLIEFADVEVVAPLEGKSGSSHSVSLSPIVCEKATVDGLFTGYAVEANPADCVKLAILELFDKPFDLIVSGLNVGSNAGVDVCYSGTVAAAMEGAFYRIAAVAVSARCAHGQDYGRCGEIAAEIIRNLQGVISPGEVLNINIPDISEGEPKGLKVVRQSCAIYQEYYTKQKNQDDKDVYQLRCSYFRENDHQTDAFAISEGFITLTPFKFDRTDNSKLEKFKAIDTSKLWQQKK